MTASMTSPMAAPAPARTCPSFLLPQLLQLQQLVDADGELLGVWAKGHHPAGCALAGLAGDPFLAAALDYLGILGHYDPDPDTIPRPDAAAVRFETWRCVPDRDSDGERWTRFVAATPGRRGAFPVTVLYLDDLPEPGQTTEQERGAAA